LFATAATRSKHPGGTLRKQALLFLKKKKQKDFALLGRGGSNIVDFKSDVSRTALLQQSG
jgi:hypothetical protein